MTKLRRELNREMAQTANTDDSYACAGVEDGCQGGVDGGAGALEGCGVFRGEGGREYMEECFGADVWRVG